MEEYLVSIHSETAEGIVKALKAYHSKPEESKEIEVKMPNHQFEETFANGVSLVISTPDTPTTKVVGF